MTARNAVHRLTNMVVEEVSLVNRAANKRTILIAKNEGGLIPNGDGTFRTADGQPAPALAAPVSSETPAPEAPTTKATASLTEPMKLAMVDVLTTAIDAFTAALGMVNNATIVEAETDADIVALLDPIMLGSDVIEDLLSSLSSAETTEVENQATPQGETTKSATLTKRLAVATAKRVVAKAEVSTLVGVAKLGRKMSKDRLARFEQILTGMGELFAELQPAFLAATKVEEETPKSGTKKPAPAVVSTVAPATKTEDASVAKAASLEAENARLRTVNKSLQGRIDAAASNAPRSNAIPVEGESVKKTDQDYSWPVDMNRVPT